MKSISKISVVIAAILIIANCSAMRPRFEVLPAGTAFPTASPGNLPIPVRTIPVAFNTTTGLWSFLFQHRALRQPPKFKGWPDYWLTFEDVSNADEFSAITYNVYEPATTKGFFSDAVKIYDTQYKVGYLFVKVPFIRGQTLYDAAQAVKRTITKLQHGNFIDNFAWIPEDKVMDPVPYKPVGTQEKYKIDAQETIQEIWHLAKEHLKQ